MWWLGWVVVALGAEPSLDGWGSFEVPAADAVDPAEARIARAEEALRTGGVRVLVLDADAAQRARLAPAIRDRLGRADPVMVDVLDLHQRGRRDPVGQVQSGRVPDGALAEVRAELRRLASELRSRPHDLGIGGALIALTERLWFVDRPEVRRLLFELYVEIGRLAHGADQQVPPFFGVIGAHADNVYLYRAAAMLWEEREAGVDVVTSARPSGEVGRALDAIVEGIDAGRHPPLPLALHVGGAFDPVAFAAEHRSVVVNGLEREVSTDGLVLVPRGRIDVALTRDGGAHGLSDRIDVVRLDRKAYFVREAARQALGVSLRAALDDLPGDCHPPLPDDVVADLATYAALHPADRVVVALPRSRPAGGVHLWAWVPEEGRLHTLIDVDRGFPVRFGLLASSGVGFAGVDRLGVDGVAPEVELVPAYVPIDVQLRAHWSRLWVAAGLQVGPAIEGAWVERYPVDGHRVVPRDRDAPVPEELLRRPPAHVFGYGLVGVVFGKRAPLGLGPRLGLRAGALDAPRAVDLTIHGGASTDPSFGRRPPTRRVSVLLDLDLYGGVWIPYGDTVARRPDGGVVVRPNLGVTVGAGLTF